MKALAITDTGNLHGCHEFYKACKSEGIKPILGIEIFVKSPYQQELKHRLVLLAKSIKGYRNLIALASKGSLENPGQIPSVMFEDLHDYAEDVICLSGPVS